MNTVGCAVAKGCTSSFLLKKQSAADNKMTSVGIGMLFFIISGNFKNSAKNSQNGKTNNF